MLEAYSHVIMMDVYLSGQERPENLMGSRETAGSEGFSHTSTLPRWFTPGTSSV